MIRLLITFMFFGCGREAAINADLKASVERYLSNAPNHGHYSELVSVDWGEPPNGALGQCVKIPQLDQSYARKVRIKRRGDSQIVVDTLVAHELAHCLHDKVHDDTRRPMLMNTVFLEGQEAYWESNLDSEIREALK